MSAPLAMPIESDALIIAFASTVACCIQLQFTRCDRRSDGSFVARIT